jgi:alpha-D-xyloside xylohydrolase
MFMHYYDSTNPKAREYIWSRVRNGYYRYGIRAWWLDACEPEMYPMNHDNLRFNAGNGLQVGNIYPLMHAKAFYDGMRSEGETEILSLCRSGWAGSQRYGSAVWSGDIASTFETLRIQVKAGLNMAMSGIPWWTTDIGGFHGGDPESPEFRELVIRWFQFGVFCPIFRLHGHRAPTAGATGGPNEVWSFGEEAYGIIVKLIEMRGRMKPYILEHMRSASEKGEPLMRPLFYGFPEDEEAYAVDDEFLFGPDILVAPVLHKGATSRTVYLPKGVTWINCWTDEEHTGGKTIDVDAPIDMVPFLKRKGSNVVWIS